MSDMNESGRVPPDLPPEYAEAYRRGYQRAYEQSSPSRETSREPSRERGREPSREQAMPAYAAHRAEPHPEPTGRLDDLFSHTLPAEQPYEPRERPRWLVPALLAALALALIVAAYAVGRAFSTSVNADNAGSGSGKLVMPSNAVSGQPSASGQSGQATQQPGGRYTGATDLAGITAASATCQSGDAFDAGGNRVSYQPANVFDQDMSTAWRCNGDGHGQTLTIDLAHSMPIGEVGLVAGYAKTDPYDGSDRYAQNDRITKVRWTFDDGHSVVQRLDGSAHDRRMQTMRIPVTTTGTVKMTILDSTPGPRNTVAVSEVRIGRVAG